MKNSLFQSDKCRGKNKRSVVAYIFHSLKSDIRVMSFKLTKSFISETY